MCFFEFRVQLESQNQNPENPHEIKENEETSFVVQTQGVQIAKDVSIRVFDRWIRTLENELSVQLPIFRSMNDYFMLVQADKGFLVSKQDGRISRSLAGRSLEGLTIV